MQIADASHVVEYTQRRERERERGDALTAARSLYFEARFSCRHTLLSLSTAVALLRPGVFI